MIQFQHLRVEEFRGIRSLDLALDSASFVIYGPNGSGKSGIVDAIDFAITGDISRLNGPGTGDVSVAKHGPHVHKRDDPAAAKVILTVKDTDSDQVAVMTRSVKTPKKYTLDPDTPEMRQAIDKSSTHPELTLSRRELIKYVVSKPGDRAAEVQTLLKLDRIGTIRKLLRSVSSKATADLNASNAEQNAAEASFLSHLGLTTLLAGEVLRVINERRKVLGLTELKKVDANSDFLAGYTGDKKANQINLATAQTEATALAKQATKLTEIEETRKTLETELKTLAEDTSILDAIQHRTLLDSGLLAVEGPECPLCETPWDSMDALETHLKARIERTGEAQALKGRIIAAASAYQSELRNLREDLSKVLPSATAYGDDDLPHLVRTWSDKLLTLMSELEKFETIVSIGGDLATKPYSPPANILAKLKALETALKSAPDRSAEESAQTFLSLAKDRWARVRLARATTDKTKAAQEAAQAIYDSYCKSADAVLVQLYATVEKDFSSYYQFVNSDDEGSFRAELQPSAGSLDLSVDFHTLGMFPPAAYHSEGHQDGMGVCLYLALVKQLLGKDFRYAVLDDVVMSVDSNHRRKFGELLKKEFPDVQFIITTHDEVWARQMRSAGVVTSKSMARFHGWTVDSGPVLGHGDILERIEEDLSKNDVTGAAHKLRRMLEADCADIVEGLQGQVKYRSDAAYDLSAFIDSAKSRHGQLLKMAAGSAQSWKDDVQSELVIALKASRDAAIPEQVAESWLVNKLVHNADWANATVADFRPVLEATQNFLNLFRCSNPVCESWISISGKFGEEEGLRCACQTYNLNLKKKK